MSGKERERENQGMLNEMIPSGVFLPALDVLQVGESSPPGWRGKREYWLSDQLAEP